MQENTKHSTFHPSLNLVREKELDIQSTNISSLNLQEVNHLLWISINL